MNNLRTLSNVFSGTDIFLAASSNIAIRSVNGLSANAGIFLVEVYIFKFISRESKLNTINGIVANLAHSGHVLAVIKKAVHLKSDHRLP